MKPRPEAAGGAAVPARELVGGEQPFRSEAPHFAEAAEFRRGEVRVGSGREAAPRPLEVEVEVEVEALQGGLVERESTSLTSEGIVLEARIPDPLERALAQPAAVIHQRATTMPAGLDQVAAQLVRRCSLAGDGRSGRVRLEIGAGRLSGSVVTLSYDDQTAELQVEVELEGQDTAEQLEGLTSAMRRRLIDRGLPLSSFTVS